jgi:hypothetical protein
MSFARNPRFAPLAMAVLGAAAVAVFIAIDGMSLAGRGGGKALFLLGLGSVAFGIGLAQLAWPPPPARPGGDRGLILDSVLDSFARASWPQRILYGLGALFGALAAAVAQTIAAGGY